MNDKNDQMKKDAQKKQMQDRMDLAKDKAKLEGHKAEEKMSDLNKDIKKDWQHTKNVADEKLTETKNTLDEERLKAKHRWEEKTGK